MEFKYSKIGEGTVAEWEEWDCPPYKIVSYRKGHFYAYYMNGPAGTKYVCEPPHQGKCTGCGSYHCTGIHAIWDSLEAAQKDCLEHYANLPW